MRIITLFLFGLAVLIQFPLWTGKGGWEHAWELEDKLATAKSVSAEKTSRNEKLRSEVKDLEEGTEAVEERARFEMNMIKEREIFVQLTNGKVPSAPAVTPPENKPQ